MLCFPPLKQNLLKEQCIEFHILNIEFCTKTLLKKILIALFLCKILVMHWTSNKSNKLEETLHPNFPQHWPCLVKSTSQKSASSTTTASNQPLQETPLQRSFHEGTNNQSIPQVTFVFNGAKKTLYTFFSINCK